MLCENISAVIFLKVGYFLSVSEPKTMARSAAQLNYGYGALQTPLPGSPLCNLFPWQKSATVCGGKIGFFNVLRLVSRSMQIQNEIKNSHLTDSQRLKFRLWLQKQFTDRCSKNPRYSLRAFADFLKRDASSISQILSGKRAPSKNLVIEICDRLSASPKDLKIIGIRAYNEIDDAYQLSMDTFAVMADWYHYAILELTEIKSFRDDPKWIASKLEISVQEAKVALERLIRIGLLKKQNGSLVKTHEVVTNHTGLNTSAAKKSLQRQVISKALNAIDDVEQEEKDITSMTMAIDPKNLDRARELTKAFRRELCTILGDGERSQVYNLAIQIYPISKKSKKEPT